MVPTIGTRYMLFFVMMSLIFIDQLYLVDQPDWSANHIVKSNPGISNLKVVLYSIENCELKASFFTPD